MDNQLQIPTGLYRLFSFGAESPFTVRLWLSPGCLFGGQPMMPRMQEYGFETLSYGMSMTGKKYMLKLEERVLELARMEYPTSSLMVCSDILISGTSILLIILFRHPMMKD